MKNKFSKYRDIPEALEMIDPPERDYCLQILKDNRKLFKLVQGSSSNHHFWTGGYYDHVREVMNIAIELYSALSKLRPLTFSLSDALLILFLHDIEKPWKYKIVDGKIEIIKKLTNKKDQIIFRDKKLKEYRIVLTPKQQNAFEHVEGEILDYSTKHRSMNKLAAFCHMCDIASARLWYDRPDKWVPDR